MSKLNYHKGAALYVTLSFMAALYSTLFAVAVFFSFPVLASLGGIFVIILANVIATAYNKSLVNQGHLLEKGGRKTSKTFYSAYALSFLSLLVVEVYLSKPLSILLDTYFPLTLLLVFLSTSLLMLMVSYPFGQHLKNKFFKVWKQGQLEKLKVELDIAYQMYLSLSVDVTEKEDQFFEKSRKSNQAEVINTARNYFSSHVAISKACQ